MLLVPVFVSLLILNANSECPNDNKGENNKEKKLYEDLRCERAYYKPPGNSTVVNLNITLVKFYFENEERTFAIDVWMKMRWHDPRLEWNPEDYDGITRVNMWSLKIWSPIPMLYHKEDFVEYQSEFYPVYCSVTNVGDVSCDPRQTYTVLCSTSLDNWPFDVQNCTINLSVRKGWTDDVIYKCDNNFDFILDAPEYNPNWAIIDYADVKDTTGPTKITFSFLLARQGYGVAAIIILPTFAATLLMISSMLLDVKDNIRLGLSILTLLSHFHLLRVIGELVPHHGTPTPKIILLLRFSIIFCTLIIFLYFVLKIIKQKTNQPYLWIVSFNDYVKKSRFKRLVLFESDNMDITPDEISTGMIWTDFANIINSLFLYITFVLYLVIFLVYIPRPRSANITNENM